MSNNTTNLVHPEIKKTIKNLDLDLGSELSRYEYSLHDSTLIAQSSNDNSFDRSLLYASVVMEEPPKPETIPAASRLIDDGVTIIDRILTPWGIVGIIMFFGANLFIFFNLDKYSPNYFLLN